jgi:dCMP deaminase
MSDLNSSRPDWDVYYLSIAFVVAQRSFDPSTKCGCVIVSQDNRILSSGYNGPIKGSLDHLIPLTRPEKYYHFIHAEENALIHYSGSHMDIQNATIYVTHPPCHKCLRMILQKGIKNIVTTPNVTKVVDEADIIAQRLMLQRSDVIYKKVSFDMMNEIKIGLEIISTKII